MLLFTKHRENRLGIGQHRANLPTLIGDYNGREGALSARRGKELSGSAIAT